MRLLITILFLIITSNIYAQTIDSIKVNYESKDASIQQVINDLESEYGIRFSYSTSSWMDTKVDISFQDKSIDYVLEFLLSEEDIEYKKVNNNILLRKSASYKEDNNLAYKASTHLKGKVKTDSEEIGSLAYAIVMVQNSSIGTYTDEDGKFDLEIPKEYSSNNIVVSYLGFEDAVYKLSELKDEYVLLKLTEQSFSITEVVIKNRKKPVRIGGEDNSIALSNTQIKSQISGVMGNDVNRSIQLLPGITAHDDDSSDIKIRGSNSDQTLMILDGMPIYNADHYYGIFSGINSAYINSVNIYKNTYPIQYGGKTAGVVELFSYDNVNKAETQLGLDLLTVSGTTKIPISNNSMIQVAGRTTPLGISNGQFNSTTSNTSEEVSVNNFGSSVKGNKNDPEFSFYDLNASYVWQDSTDLSIKINFYRSKDEFDNDFKIKIRDMREDEVDLKINERQDWTTTASSIIWNQPLSEKININNRVYYSDYQNIDKNDINIEKKFNQGGNPPPQQNPNGVLLGAKHENDLTDFGLNSYLNYSSGNQNFIIGACASQQNIHYLFAENNETKLSGRGQYLSMSAYTSYSYNLKNKLSITGGIRSTYHDKLKSYYFSPRFLFNYKINNNIVLKGSYSYVQQIIRQLYYEYRSEPLELWVAAGENDLPVLSSKNLMMGTTFKIGALTLDIEAFQKLFDGTIEYAVLDPTNNNNNPDRAQDYQLFFGEGLVRGIDFMASFGYRKYDSYISYTLSRSQERYREIYRNRYYASENDRRHQFKWVNTIQTGSWTFDLNSIYSSGRPYTEIEKKDDNGDIRNAEPDDRLKRLPAYLRIDAGIGYTISLSRQKVITSLSVFNLMNAQNVKYIQSVNTQLSANQLPVNTVIDSESSLLNRTINVGVKVAF